MQRHQYTVLVSRNKRDNTSTAFRQSINFREGTQTKAVVFIIESYITSNTIIRPKAEICRRIFQLYSIELTF